MKTTYHNGSALAWMVTAIAGLTLFIAAAVFGVWAYVSYIEQKSDVDAKIGIAQAEAAKIQADEDEEKFQESYKNPKLEFVGPAEYGRISFMYPKTWSVYVDKDGSDRGDYKAYYHPVIVPPTGKKDSRFALRLEVINANFDTVMRQYEQLLKKGELKSSTPVYNGIATTRLDGAFSKEVHGSVVIFKMRDKTVRFSTDAETFRPDYKAVLDTVKYIE